MRIWPIAAAAMVAIESAALACSCLATTDPAELKRLAPDAAKNAIALVEVETIVPYHESEGAGDRMRIVRTLAGSASAEFLVERGQFPSSASCDLLFDRGHRDVVILYPASSQAATAPKYRISGLCTDHLLDQPIFRDEVKRLIERGWVAGERG